MLKGLNHITLSVSDLARSVAYYTELLGFSLRARWNRGAYLALGDLWLCLSHDAHVREGPLAEYTHFALTVDARVEVAGVDRVDRQLPLESRRGRGWSGDAL